MTKRLENEKAILSAARQYKAAAAKARELNKLPATMKEIEAFVEATMEQNSIKDRLLYLIETGHSAMKVGK